MIQVCHLGIDSFFSPVSLLRVFPYAYLNNVKVVSGGKLTQIFKEKGHVINFKFEANYEAIKKSNIAFVQRSFLQESTIKILDDIIKSRKKIIYDTDDLLVKLPQESESPWSKLHINSEKYLKDFMPLFNVFTTTNNYLADQLKKTFDYRHIKTVPNLILSNFFKRIKKNTSNQDFFKILIGGRQKLNEISPIVGALKKILKEHKNVLIFFTGFKEKILEFENEKRVFYSGAKAYPEYLKNIDHIRPDITISPLRDTLFNNCKSNIKFLEYSYLDIPGIYSDVYPYKNSIDSNITGILCSANDDWYEKIHQLIIDQDLRYNISKNAYNFVEKNYLIENKIDIFKKICNSLM